MWHGLQTITDYKGKASRELSSDACLPDKLNTFYAHFEASNTERCMREPLNTGFPQGGMLSPLLHALFTHDCGATHDSNTIIKFADDTTVVA